MAPEPVAPPRRLALLVATSEYQDSAFHELRGAVGDVGALEAVLTDPTIGDYQIVGSVVNRARQDVEEAIADFFRSGRPQDLLLLYLSGHGVLSETRRHWFFVTHNSKRSNLEATAIWDAWLKERMANSRSNSIVLVLDCCHSGAFIEGWPAKGGREVHVETHFDDAGTGRLTFTASTALEYAFEVAAGSTQDLGSAAAGSLFTKHLVHGLQSREADMDGDGRVSADELFRYVETKLQSEVPRQTPGRGGQSFGPIYVAHGRRTFLSSEIWAGIASQNAAMREGMVRTLAVLRQTTAQQPLEEVTDAVGEIDAVLARLVSKDKSDAVRQAASAALEAASAADVEPRDLAAQRAAARSRPRLVGLRRAGFGSPDGSRSQHRDLMADFVELSGVRAHGDLGRLVSNDRAARVLVGRRGAGKTVYLRRLQAAASAEPAVYAADVDLLTCSTSDVIRVLDMYGEEQTAVERWEAIWRCGIVRAAVSHLVRGRNLPAWSTPDFANSYTSILPDMQTRLSIHSQVREILGAHSTRNELDRYLNDRLWTPLEQQLGEVLRDCPPMFFYLDGLDERFEHAPRHWALCQWGLLNALMSMWRDPRFARLHVVIGIRDIVFSLTQASERATTYIDPTFVRVLDWDRPAIDYFLQQKVQTLDVENLMEPEAGEPMRRWLGLTTIYDDVRGTEELVNDYVVRHTRLVPRDIIVVGNMLSERVREAHDDGRAFLSHGEVRAAVGEAARRFGSEELRSVANHLTAGAMPLGAAMGGYADFYIGETAGTDGYQQAMAEELRKIIREVGVDRFGRDRLTTLSATARDRLQTEVDPVEVLWQHRLIGYIDGPVATSSVAFYSPTNDRLHLPASKRGYAFHPTVLAALDLRAVGHAVLPD